MRRTPPICLALASMLCACGQEHAPAQTAPKAAAQAAIQPSTESPIADFQLSEKSAAPDKLHSRQVYLHRNGQRLVVENSYPRGGEKYTDAAKKEYVYAVFWTRIANETDEPLELAMDFEATPYPLPSSPGRSFQLVIPSDTLTRERESLPNYGLDVETALDRHLHQKSALRRTVGPRSGSGFYVVALFNRGVEGTMRAGLRIEDGKILYRVNGTDIDCGHVNLQALELLE